MIIPIIALSTALFKAIKLHGITDIRYICMIITIWMIASTIYHLFNKSPKFKVVVFMLSMLFIISSIGPFGSKQISIKSQLSRLENVLIQNNILNNNHIIKSSKEISDEEYEDIFSMVQYISDTTVVNPIKNWFDSNSYINTTTDSGRDIRKILDDMGLKNPLQKDPIVE